MKVVYQQNTTFVNKKTALAMFKLRRLQKNEKSVFYNLTYLFCISLRVSVI